MFEGVIHRVLVGYLGRYVKDFQKDQLKLSLWNEEILLENVELIPEAFDYLQLPFALKHGRVGRLSIKISWKKLGWDHPIIIALEDVFVCASRWDDQDWSLSAVEKREFAGKKAQLAAAELAKLSRCVCDNQTGKSFISFITAKVLDSIQVSIKSFHLQYSEMQLDSAQILFGLRFSSLTVKQILVGSSSGKVVGGQLNKTLDIKGLAIYCGTPKGVIESTSLDDEADYKFWCNEGSDSNLFDYLLHPFDVSVSLVFNRAGKLDGDSPQYSIAAELTAMAMCFNEVQLQHILTLSDYLSTSHLREKYGRYRPWGSPLSRKLDGWQKLWWHYAQESVLSDVRRKLKKSSWRYLGQRLNYRRKYITLYKTKLELLQHEQSIDETILGELEQMEKECDIEDILSYRSAAELEMQELLSNSLSVNTRVTGGNVSIEKSRNDDRALGRSRGWLNWLSRGMLGAGGTDDSGQFSGVVSDEVIKDIYEATKFHPSVASSNDADINDKIFTCAIKCSITQYSLTLESLSLSRKVANLVFKDLVIELKLGEELATVICFIKSGEMVESLNKTVILQTRRSFLEENEREDEVISFKVEVEVLPKEDFQLSVKIMLQPLELNCDVDFLLNFTDFFAVLKSFEFQSDRVLLSLNGIKDVKTRLLSKAEYILSTHRKFYWHISINEVVIYIPWKNGDSEGYNLVLELGSLLYTSKFGPDAVSSSTEEQSYILQQLPGFHMQDLYDYSEVKLNNFQSKLMMPQCPQTINILDRICASLTLVSCIISDESILKQLEVYIVLPSLDASFSLSLLESVVAFVEHLQAIQSRSGCLLPESPSFPKVLSSKSAAPIFGFSIVAKLHSVSLHIDLANDGENSSELLFSLQELFIRYVHTELEECWVCSKALKIIFSPLRGQNHSHILYSSGHQYTSSSSHQQELGFSHKCVCTKASFLLHYEARQGVDLIFHKCTVDLNDAEIHCFPFIFGLLFGFYNRLVVYAASFAHSSSFSTIMANKIPIKMPGFQFQKFGYSNFIETGSSEHTSISLDSYPFITICNSGSLGSPESSFCNSMPDWRRLFNLRDGKPRSPKFGLMEGAKTRHDLAFAYKSGTDAAPVAESLQDSSLFNININLGGIRVHFHDSSCIVGTVALASCKLSLVACDESMDLLCSAEGLNLTSSWWTNNLKEFLWGPSLPNLSPLLNVRLRKGNVVSSTSALEVSIGIQHVLCILPSEYLAIIIGYFSLPEWSSYLREQLITDDHKGVASENGSQIVYKFEILDSTLIFPVDQDDHRFLKIELPQLYGSFIHNCAPDDLLKDIPPQIMVPVHKVAKASHCLNIFGRDLYLSLLLHKDDDFGHLMAHQDIEPNNIALIEPVSADVWVRLPYETAGCFRSSSVFTCIMSRISTCQLIADDCNRLNGIEALLDVINQFASVDVESKYFTSDVLHFLQLKRSLKESGAFLPLSFGTFLTEVQCSVESLAIILCHHRDNASALEPVAKADMQFVFSASLINETPTSMDVRLSSLTLRSVLSAVILMQCIDSCSVFSALHIHFSKSIEGANDLHVSLPSLDIWLHMFDWTAVIDLAMNISKKKAETAPVEAPSKSLPEDIVDPSKSVAVTVCQTSLDRISMQQVSEEQNSILMVRSEDIGITVHFPIVLNKSRIAEFNEGRHQNVSSNSIAAKDCNFVAITVHHHNSKLSMASGSLQMKFSLEKTSGSLGICEDKRITTWPLFQISQINLVTQSSKNQMELVSVNLGVECNRLDVWLSHRVFCFWHDISFDIPELASPQSSFCSMDFRIALRKASLLISDEKWTCGGPLLEILLGDVLLLTMMTENSIKCSVDSNLDVNYNNIHKVLWEPFVEPWKFQINMIRKQETTALLSSSMTTDIHLSSTAQLNLNFTESLIECICRTSDMVKDSICSMQPNEPCENRRFLSSQLIENISGGRYAPYVLQNLTSLPLVYHVSEGFVNSDEFEVSQKKDGKSVDPGASVPIFLNKTPEEQLFCHRPAQSSDRLNEKQPNGVFHHFMSIQLDGTSLSSVPISMDRVGLTYFEVDFSKISNKMNVSKEEGVSNYEMHIEENAGFVVPVIFDVTMQRYNKLIRVYSTVIVSNATSMPLELRFDIPLGVSPKILDPIAPGQKFPLPIHLAEAGRMRWRPRGRSYLWSDVYDLTNIISQESQFGFLKSFVCYPSHPSSDPFRCCMSVQNFGLLSSSKPKRGLPLPIDCTLKGLMESSDYERRKSKKKFIHQLTLSTPLVVNSYLPDPVSMTIESGGVTRTVLLSEEGTSFHHVDPSHDVGLELYLHGFRPSSFKFPRAEIFGAVAKFNGTKLSQTETITFDPDSSHGQLYVTMEKMMDAFSGARELFIFVPFILYNCTSLPLNIESATSMRANYCSIPSSYNLIQQEVIQEKKDGLCLLASKQDSSSTAPQIDGLRNSFSNNQISLASKDSKYLSGGLINKSFIISGSSKPTYKQSDENNLIAQGASLSRSTGGPTLRNSDFVDTDHGKVKACMYSPCEISSVTEIMVRVCACLPEHIVENVPNLSWSDPFLLVPPSGSNTVLIPQSSSNAAFIISVTSSALIGSVAGQTRVITFQPRFVISNACSKDLCYKQKGTDFSHHLDIGQHSHLHWTDRVRELLVSIRFNEPGWQWSGSFSPDHLGDTQVKLWNYVSGALTTIRVEVLNADVSIKDEQIVGSLHGNSGTNLILLSDDDTGFMPYRIDNFSKERLRIYQQRCETFDTIVHPYTSCPYAWDEPCYPHRLAVEVPGERVVGLYALDDPKEYIPVHLRSTSEKPERTLLLSVLAEGATKVLRIVDSSCHNLRDLKVPFRIPEKRKYEQKHEDFVDYNEKFSFVIPYLGISLINAYPQELLFACAKNITLDLLQSPDLQMLSFQISSLQVDNQLRKTPYPVMLSFNQEYNSNTASQRAKDDGLKSKSERLLAHSSESYCEPVVYLAVATWRKKDILLASFQHVKLRVANFRLELEQELILSVLDFFKAVSSRFQNNALPHTDSTRFLPLHNVGFIHAQPYDFVETREDQLYGVNFPASNYTPSVVPIGAPWQRIHLLARRQKNIYVELLDLAPIKLTLSFSSTPWRNGVLTLGESLIPRGLMALADVEGAQIHLKRLTIAHQIASWESMQGILIRHYTRQVFHEMYKVFGSAGIIGNPMGFARSLGLGIRDFLSVPARSILQSPAGLITGMAQGTTSLVSNTVYALSDAATQFSKAAHKGIVAFTFDEQSVARIEKQQKASHSKGVINEVLEGLTGVLQSPIKEAEKHGLPGVISGIALGVTGLVARPAASILEVTGKTAQSIRNRSRLYQVGSQLYRVRLPRPLSRELPLRPYSLEEAVGASVLMEVDDGLKMKGELLVRCKSLKQAGKFVILTERLLLVVSCPSLIDIGRPESRGIPINPEWMVETEISLDRVINVSSVEGVVHIIASTSYALQSQKQHQLKRSDGAKTKHRNNSSSPFPLIQTNLELASEKDAEDLLQVLLAAIEQGKGHFGRNLIQQSNKIRIGR